MADKQYGKLFKRHDSLGSQTQESMRRPSDAGGNVKTGDDSGYRREGLQPLYSGHDSYAANTDSSVEDRDFGKRPRAGLPGKSYRSGDNARGTQQRRTSYHDED